MAPGADPLQEFGIRRADRIAAGIPSVRANRRVTFDQRDAQAGVAQGDGEAGAGKAAADDDQVKLLHDGDYAVSQRRGKGSGRIAAAALRLVLARAPVAAGARAVLRLLLLAAARLAVLTATGIAHTAALRLLVA